MLAKQCANGLSEGASSTFARLKHAQATEGRNCCDGEQTFLQLSNPCGTDNCETLVLLVDFHHQVLTHMPIT